MKRNQTLYTIVTLLMVLALSITLLPTQAQDDWPEGCELPDLDEVIAAAESAREAGDVVAFVDKMAEVNRVVDSVLKDCLVSSNWVDVELELVGLNLSETDLQDLWLYFANLQEADLTAANLQNAMLGASNLSSANMTSANLVEAQLCVREGPLCHDSANLDNAILEGANLNGAILIGVNLQGANLNEANLQEARFGPATRSFGFVGPGANLLGASLRGASLQGAILTEANLKNADLTDATLDENTILPDDTNWTPEIDMARFTDPEHPAFWRGYGLEDADLQRMDFSGANLLRANLRLSNLQGARLSRANLQGVRFFRANLRGTDLSGANLRDADLRDAIFNENIILPDGTNWTPETDMARFTEPEHLDFWDPCVELEDQPWYCEGEDGE